MVAKLASLTNCMWFYIIKIQDFEYKHDLQGQSRHIQCLMFLLNWLKEFISLRLSGKRDQS